MPGADINLLDDLGYRSFKCIRQNDLHEINPGNVVYQEEFRRGLNRLEWLPRREILLVVQRLRYRRRSVNGWKFKHGSSGPLGWNCLAAGSHAIRCCRSGITLPPMISVWVPAA